MELRRFQSLDEAEGWYRSRSRKAGGEVDALFLALCLGDDEGAQALYREYRFPSRWWADVTYVQGHYLIRLRRRDRMIALVRSLGIDTPGADASDDPWLALEAIARAIEAHARDATSAVDAATLQCVLGHVYLAMDYHEAANASYRSALRLNPSVWLTWENMQLLAFVREERSGSRDEAGEAEQSRV